LLRMWQYLSYLTPIASSYAMTMIRWRGARFIALCILPEQIYFMSENSACWYPRLAVP
jgi:hypothetical protein